MSSEIKFKHHDIQDESYSKIERKVKLTDLLSRMNHDKKKERNSNIALTIAAISAVTVFGIILSI